MGDRASYAVRERGVLHLFYSQFGANTLLADVFWGPEAAEAAIRAQEPADSWLDDVDGEAAIALCKDTRTVAFYDCRYSAEASATAARMMTALWPGWTVRAARWVSGVAAAIGVDLATPHVLDAPPPLNLHPLDPDVDGDDQALPLTLWLEERRGDERVVRVCERHVAELLGCGPLLLDASAQFAALEEARAAARALSVRGGARVTLLGTDALHPPALVRIDRERAHIDVTLLPTLSAIGARAATLRAALRWPGWTVTCVIDEAATFFAAVGEPVPDDLLPAPAAPPPLLDQVGELADRLLGGEQLKRFAARWLGHVSALTGVSPLEAPPAGALDDEARLDRFARGLAALDLPRETIPELLERAARATRATQGSHDFALPLGPFPRVGLVRYDSLRRDGRTFAVHWGDRSAPPQLLFWASEESLPVALCALGDAPMQGSYAGMALDPEGRTLAVVLELEYQRHALYCVDLARGQARLAGRSSRRASFDTAAPLAFGPARADGARDLAIEATDRTTGRFGSAVVVIVSARGEPLAEHARTRLETFSAWPADPAPSARAAAATRLDGEPTPSERERLEALAEAGDFDALELAGERAAVESSSPYLRNLALRLVSWARLERGDAAGAVLAAERAAEIAPFSRDVQQQRARALVAAGELERAAEAALRARDCNRWSELELAEDPAFAPLHGLPAFAELDYARLVQGAARARANGERVAQLAAAIRLAPERDQAWRNLLAAIAEEPARAELCEAWYVASPGSYAASLACALSRLTWAPAEAEALLVAMIERWPARFEPPLHLARARAGAGAREAALAALRLAAARFDPRDHDYTFLDEAEEYEELAELLDALRAEG